MESALAVRAHQLGKCYHVYNRPQDRLKQFIFRRRKYFREFWAIRNVSFELRHGEVLGVIGRNGSGKSTLLQLLSGTLTPSHGELAVHGRIAALLELGAGFNPEFSGRENVFLNGAILGLSEEEISRRFDEIVAFSGIADFIDQPVKTYSSGMYVRLAFAVAINVDPDILIIDEALSVGDGEFARRSFDRIMALKDAGKTILFCSHSMYQVEAICNRAIWLANGEVMADGDPAMVTASYTAYLGRMTPGLIAEPAENPVGGRERVAVARSGTATFVDAILNLDGQTGRRLDGVHLQSNLDIEFSIASDPSLPVPTVGFVIFGDDGRVVSSLGSLNDGVVLPRDAQGISRARVSFKQLPLLKGRYQIDGYVLCERGIHVYDTAPAIGIIDMTQTGRELGIATLPHLWQIDP